MHAFILVVISVVWTFFGLFAKEVDHIVLIKVEIASIAVGIFVILIEFTAIAACLVLISVFRKIHVSSKSVDYLTTIL